MAERIREHTERAQCGIDRIKILDLVVEVALCRGINLWRPGALKQNLHKER